VSTEFASFWSGFYDDDFEKYDQDRPDLTCRSCLHGFGYTYSMQDAEGESFAEVPWWLERNTKDKFANCALCDEDSFLPPECFGSDVGYCCYDCVESPDLWCLDPEDDCRCGDCDCCSDYDYGYSTDEDSYDSGG
jgi:hypothetical protein